MCSSNSTGQSSPSYIFLAEQDPTPGQGKRLCGNSCCCRRMQAPAPYCLQLQAPSPLHPGPCRTKLDPALSHQLSSKYSERITDFHLKGRGIGECNDRLLRPAQHTKSSGAMAASLIPPFSSSSTAARCLLPPCLLLVLVCLLAACARADHCPLALHLSKNCFLRTQVSAPWSLGLLRTSPPLPLSPFSPHSTRPLACQSAAAMRASIMHRGTSGAPADRPLPPARQHPACGTVQHVTLLREAWWCAILCRPPFGVCGTDYLKVRLHLRFPSPASSSPVTGRNGRPFSSLEMFTNASISLQNTGPSSTGHTAAASSSILRCTTRHCTQALALWRLPWTPAVLWTAPSS